MNPPSITLMVITDGRGWCLQKTLRSFVDHVDQKAISTRIVVNDAAEEPTYQTFVDDLCADFDIRVPSSYQRRGFSGAINAGWEAIRNHGVPDFVFHLEDDFQFNRDIDVAAMADVLIRHPELAQMCLRRQPWNAKELEAGGVIELHPEDYIEVVEDGQIAWLEHRRFFSTNPSLYRGELTRRGWPEGEHSEGRFGISLFTSQPDTRVAYWGRRNEPPLVHHFGLNRVGSGY